MKIATWNIERLRHKNMLSEINAICAQIAADIFVLIEPDLQIDLGYKHCLSTLSLNDAHNYYKASERRVSIYTSYDFVRNHATFDEHAAICAELKTPDGNLLVYGTIIGIYDNRNQNFMEDLSRQAYDITRLAADYKNLCVIGDFNCSF
jgi:endonuclease/exonuclease/phosphatase family metal-dependent hydrolase